MESKINTTEKVNAIRSWFLEMINKIDKPLAAGEGKNRDWERHRDREEIFNKIL